MFPYKEFANSHMYYYMYLPYIRSNIRFFVRALCQSMRTMGQKGYSAPTIKKKLGWRYCWVLYPTPLHLIWCNQTMNGPRQRVFVLVETCDSGNYWARRGRVNFGREKKKNNKDNNVYWYPGFGWSVEWGCMGMNIGGGGTPLHCCVARTNTRGTA